MLNCAPLIQQYGHATFDTSGLLEKGVSLGDFGGQHVIVTYAFFLEICLIESHVSRNVAINGEYHLGYSSIIMLVSLRNYQSLLTLTAEPVRTLDPEVTEQTCVS